MNTKLEEKKYLMEYFLTKKRSIVFGIIFLTLISALVTSEQYLMLIILFSIFFLSFLIIGKGMYILLPLLIFVTPFDYYEIASILSASDILLIVLLFVFLSELLLKKRKIYWSVFLNPLIILNLVFLFSVLSSLNVITSLRVIITCLMATSLCFLIAQYSHNKQIRKKIFFSFIIAGYILSISGFIQYVAYNYYGLHLWKGDILFLEQGERFFRLHGIYGDPNYLIFYLIVPLIFCVLVTKYHYLFSKREKIIARIGIILILLAYILTFSRSGLLMLIFALMLLSWLEGRRKLRFLLFFLIPFIIIFVFQFTNFLIEIKPSSVYERLSANLAAWNTFLTHPIIGIGAGINPYNPYLGIRMGPHNSYLYILATTGIMGGIAFLMVILSALKKGLLVLKNIKDLEQKVIYKGFYYSLICMLFGLMTLDAIFMKHFWIILGVLLGYKLIFIKE